MSDDCIYTVRTYHLLHFNYRAISMTVTFEMVPSIPISSIVKNPNTVYTHGVTSRPCVNSMQNLIEKDERFEKV